MFITRTTALNLSDSDVEGLLDLCYSVLNGVPLAQVGHEFAVSVIRQLTTDFEGEE